MCLIVFAWKAHADYPLVVGANRDEWRDRPALAAHWWSDRPTLLAGRDQRAGGTWLGASRGGRIGAITNFRDPADRNSAAPSRGALLVDFLAGADSPRTFLEKLAPDASRYNGFNLLLADDDALCYFGSRESEVVDVAPGVHALSNHLLDEPWPKVERARAAMTAVLSSPAAAQPLVEPLFGILSDTSGAPDAALPDTGVGIEWERRLAPILIRGEQYGTLCSTVLMKDCHGRIVFEERTRGATGEVTGAAAFAY